MKKILIVDDEPSVREILSRLLKAAQFEVVLAENGIEGLKKVKKYLPDLIISDVVMPELDGISLCAAVKSDPLTNHIPFLFITTQATIGEVEEAMRQSPDGYITKPFEFPRIMKKVHALLNNH